MVLGILGVGHLAHAIVAGLMKSGFPPADVVLSPRGQGPLLAGRYGLTLAASNADLVSRSDVLLLAVRPADAVDALRRLPWAKRHTIVSVCAGIPIAALQQAASEARIVRAMPLTAAECGASATSIYPDGAQARRVFEALGAVIALRREEDFDVATVSAAIYGWAQDLMRQSIDWSSANGLDPTTARKLVANTFIAAGKLVAEKDMSLEGMLEELATPGGITERGLRVLADQGVPAAWTSACDAVLDKLRKP